MKTIVEGKLYQCGQAEAIAICESHAKLTALGLKAILTVADNVRLNAPANIVHLHLPVDEVRPTPDEYFKLACWLAGNDEYPLLVHCQAGANRSRVFAALIAHKVFGLALRDAVEIAGPPPCGVVFDAMLKWTGTDWKPAPEDLKPGLFL